MDVVSHGLWGSILFGRRNKRSFWTAFAFGILPDILVFGPIFAAALLSGRRFAGPPDIQTIPGYVFMGYNVTHSLLVFVVAFFVVMIVRRKPLFEMFAWPAHILLDLPTHSAEFFPTPYLWPLKHPTVDGIPWSSPEIFIPNVVLLAALYIWFFKVRKGFRSRGASQ